MTEIIKVELFRLKKSALFWIMLGVCAAMPLINLLITAIMYTVLGILNDIPVDVFGLLCQQATAGLLQQMSNVPNDMVLLTIISTAVILSKEFVDGTMRNVVLANKTRTELFFAYFITSMIVAVTYLIAFLTVTLVIVAPIFGFNGEPASKVVSAVFCSLALGILAMAFIESVVCMFTFCVRKQWAAVLFPILIWYGTAVLINIINMSTGAILGATQATTLNFEKWIPFYNMQLYDPMNIDGIIVGMNILYLALFIAGFTCLGLFTFKKADLK